MDQQNTETTHSAKDTTESNEFEPVDHTVQPDWSATNMPVEFGQRERDAMLAIYKQKLEQFKVETEAAIALFRKEVDDLRQQFETLKRLSRTLSVLSAERRRGADENGDESDGPSAPKRKRWGKRSFIRRRQR